MRYGNRLKDRQARKPGIVLLVAICFMVLIVIVFLYP